MKKSNEIFIGDGYSFFIRRKKDHEKPIGANGEWKAINTPPLLLHRKMGATPVRIGFMNRYMKHIDALL